MTVRFIVLIFSVCKTFYNGRLVEFLHAERFDCCALIFACPLKAEGILKFIGSGVVQATRRLYGEAIDEHCCLWRTARATATLSLVAFSCQCGRHSILTICLKC